MNSPTKSSRGFPSQFDFLFNIPLYSFYEIPKSPAPLISLASGKLDGFCIYCERETIFEIDKTGDILNFVAVPTSGFPKITIECTRNKNHRYRFYFIVAHGKIGKIGQFPSVADLQQIQIGKYRGALSDNRYREFARAIGLSAHGIGIGSFVYLRRVFEGLIEDAYKQALSQKVVDQTSYDGRRMDDKILALKDFLPPFLVENRTLYGILSKGIHSLTEEGCLEYFDTVRVGIELILDEQIQNQLRLQKLKEAKGSISNLHSKLAADKSEPTKT